MGQGRHTDRCGNAHAGFKAKMCAGHRQGYGTVHDTGARSIQAATVVRRSRRYGGGCGGRVVTQAGALRRLFAVRRDLRRKWRVSGSRGHGRQHAFAQGKEQHEQHDARTTAPDQVTGRVRAIGHQCSVQQYCLQVGQGILI